MTEPSRTPKQLPREIYVRRRVAALVAILVLVVVLIFAATALFGGSKEDSAAESQQAAVSDTLAPSEKTTSAAETTEPTSAKESAEATGSTEPAKSEAGESGKEEPTSEAKPDELTVDPSKTTCSLQDLKVLAKTNEDSVPAGKMPTFYLEVFNPTTKDCSIDLDEEQLRFEVYKMGSNERVWADTDCYASVETGKQTFKSGETRYFQADWSRKRSEPGKCTEREEAEPGAYFLHTVIGENYSPALPFNLL
ncbi:hypothetical protein HMPREF2822_06880 [Corynebacterium sp. HMSC062E11]|uniref:Secreted protein n=3 Tax=Corynebacterium TaxID=1716 RepID=A0ABU9UJS3_9CORY|nr:MULTISPECIES: hypothetical protein [unclassified Corynebacterium]MCL8494066.1 hypothetical protein [Corynebacterium intestinale]MDK6806550.1 hypothetical protein [Corynebacterium aurimucosum]MCP1390302.1 hypothetical protein [Corynebacterium intestinale]NJJ82499.1 hypothetical protein [Corynebacterium aurimucosum]OFK26522.1 hypothetical protein HMPREF2822_06880 [Corynebacterium sp. HMSC062E11]